MKKEILVIFILMFSVFAMGFVLAQDDTSGDVDVDRDTDSEGDETDSNDESDQGEEESETDAENDENDSDSGETDSDDEEEVEEESDETDSDSGAVDDETEEEIEDFEEDEEERKNHGAEFRFAQLECSIDKRIKYAGEVVDYLSDEDTSGLEDTLAELEVILDEVQNVDFELSNDELAELFVDYKQESIDIVQEFREDARALLTEDDKEALRERFSTVDAGTEECRRKIDEKRRKHYRYEAKKFLRDFVGEADEELLEKIESGEITREDIKMRLREKVDQRRDMQDEIREKVREKVDEKRVEVRERVDKAIEGQRTRIDRRIDARIDNVRAARDDLRGRLNE